MKETLHKLHIIIIFIKISKVSIWKGTNRPTAPTWNILTS